MKLTMNLIAGIILLASTFVPWTIGWGVNVIGDLSYNWFVLEFPFMEHFSVPGLAHNVWAVYKFVPKYLGMTFIFIGGIIAIIGGFRQKYESLLRWGGVSGTLALIFFMGCKSASINILEPISQSYSFIPVGAFIPALFWILVSISAPKEAIITKPATTIFCGQCGSQVSPQFNLCPFCGAKLIKPTCPNCGKEVPVQYTFCLYCGTRIKRDVTK